MAVLDRPTNHKQLTAALLSSLFMGALSFGLLLVASAAKLSTTTGQVRGGLGSLHLFELTRQALPGGGVTGGVRLLPIGLMLFFLIWLFAGLIYSMLRSKSS